VLLQAPACTHTRVDAWDNSSSALHVGDVNTAVLPAAAAPGNTLQYDYSSLLLNSSSMVRKPIPRPDAKDDPAYKVRTKFAHLQLQLAAVHAYSCITHLPATV
jgi:hypothetical protein